MSSAKSSEKKSGELVNFLSGGCASCASKTMMAPLSRAVVLYELGQHDTKRLTTLFREIVEKEGLRGLWKGNLASMIQRFPYSGIQLGLYDNLKHAMKNFTNTGEGKESTLLTKALAGGIAATLSGVAVYPMEVTRTKLMSGNPNYNTITGTIGQVWRTQGVTGFYAGLGLTLVQRVPEITLNYAVYESVRAYSGDVLKLGDAPSIFCGGSAAALVAVAACYPIDIVKRRMQMNRENTAGHRYTNSVDCAAKIYQKNGFRGFYMGASVECIKVVPQVVAMWGLIEFFRFHFGRIID